MLFDQATQQVVQGAQEVVYGGAGALGILIISNIGQWIKEWQRTRKLDKIGEKLDMLVAANGIQNERLVEVETTQKDFANACALEKNRNDNRLHILEKRVLDIIKEKGG
jgi:hypothetical protein